MDHESTSINRNKTKTRIRPWTKLFVAFQTLDLVMSWAAVRSGVAVEMNPMGMTPKLIIIKFIAILTVAYFLEWVPDKKYIWVVPGFQLAICIWNAVQIIRGIFGI
jgi:hypothetical protein